VFGKLGGLRFIGEINQNRINLAFDERVAKLYQKAVELGYTNEPGISSKAYKSTGSAALDLAIIGYNMGPTKITNYCGTQDIKKPCAPGSPDIVKNYMPNLAGSGITSFGYIGEVSTDMTKFSKIDTLF
jgi:hypothetical protein